MNMNNIFLRNINTINSVEGRISTIQRIIRENNRRIRNSNRHSVERKKRKKLVY